MLYPAKYYYEGLCPKTGELLQLPRTSEIESIALNFMQDLARDDRYSREGKMYGILLVELPSGERQILKAFSGLLNGQSEIEGWVPPIPGRNEVAIDEALTLQQLDAIKQEIISLQMLPERQEYATLSQEFDRTLQAMQICHRERKQQRQEQRQSLSERLTEDALKIAIERLDEESRRDGIDRRRLKGRRDRVLQPLQHIISTADDRIRQLKQQRKTLSRQLQEQMHAAYSLMNFAGTSRSLKQLMPGGAMPTGTGDCCAPKLLHYAATQGFKPLAMAEFWWGSSGEQDSDKIQGQFYGACAERCQPLMGFLLSGLQDAQLPIIYQDEWLIAVNKPSGLLSVPGRYLHVQDSVFSRLRQRFTDEESLVAIHRLDLETSGILLVARDRATHRQLSQQFQQRQVRKVYEAVLSGKIDRDRGAIDLPLWGNPENRPYQQVDWQHGKPSLTHFKTIAIEENTTRVEFYPLTGRTHQLRVHAADNRGLGQAILGDRLYGCRTTASRLHLHARELEFIHPHNGQTLHLKTPTPF
jgi:tRNA pseudouridine32 synthase / 23S rRNA pseudouridine746 synthase